MSVKACPHGHGYYTGRCPECKRTQNQRASSTARGYGKEHRRQRENWARIIASSITRVRCSRCGKPIEAEDDWDLDHTDDRHSYRGPSHATCNRQRLTA